MNFVFNTIFFTLMYLMYIHLISVSFSFLYIILTTNGLLAIYYYENGKLIVPIDNLLIFTNFVIFVKSIFFLNISLRLKLTFFVLEILTGKKKIKIISKIKDYIIILFCYLPSGPVTLRISKLARALMQRFLVEDKMEATTNVNVNLNQSVRLDYSTEFTDVFVQASSHVSVWSDDEQDDNQNEPLQDDSDGNMILIERPGTQEHNNSLDQLINISRRDDSLNASIYTDAVDFSFDFLLN